MSEHHPSSTINGYEIEHPREKMNASEFKEVIEGYGLGGDSPAERVKALQQATPSTVAYFLADVNRRLQGSDQALVHEDTMKVGDQEMISPEHRGELLDKLLSNICNAPEDTSPGRIGDALGLGVVILHPFKDGNGRTARMMALMFREEFDDTSNYENTFNMLSASKEEKLKNGESTIIPGYVPRYPDGKSGSDPEVVSDYFDALFTSDEYLYTGPAGQEKLKVDHINAEQI